MAARRRTRTRTVILTSRENFVWLSMQEIIPWIERSWLDSAVPGTHDVLCRNVDRHSLSELLPELLAADNVVFTCFTVKLCRIGQLLRERFALDARYFIYLHSQATILCWPFHAWGMGAFLRTDDVFLSSSIPDARTFRLSFEQSRVEVVPFTIPGLRARYRLPPSSRGEIPFIYAGRISAQKNLHTLIYAFRLFRDAHPEVPWRLLVFGTDDNLGSPNMAMRSMHYGAALQKLARLLKLEDRIAFRGHQRRSRLNRALSVRRHIAVSASIHSDENFGMAPFRSLCRGNLAVLTHWGGFADFGRQFAGLVLPVAVREAEKGPWVDPVGLAALLHRAADRYRRAVRRRTRLRVQVPRYYLEAHISARLRTLALEGRRGPAPRILRMTRLAARILEKRERFARGNPRSERIFASYSDPDTRALFRSYLMRRQKAARRAPLSLLCCPWVRVVSHGFRAYDLHRGTSELKLSGPGRPARGSVLVSDWFDGRARVSRADALRLLSFGWAHRSPGPAAIPRDR
jgi:glycosyltransferase involved in cell wall biosynthesis